MPTVSSADSGAEQPGAGQPVTDNPAAEARIADEDRNRVIEQLKVATGEGRLTLDEFSERLDIVFASRVASDLSPALLGLPATLAYGP